MFLQNPALLAALATTGIALFSAAMVFSVSGGNIVQALFPKPPQTLEPISRNDQETDVEVFQQDKKAKSVIEEVASEQEKEGASILLRIKKTASQ
jgi:hypothetical protein